MQVSQKSFYALRAIWLGRKRSRFSLTLPANDLVLEVEKENQG